MNHGVKASDKAYEYIVVPATSIEKLESQYSKRNIEILSNTPELQVVKNKALGIVELVFYKLGEINLSEKVKLSSDSPGIIMVKLAGDQILEISDNDPNRELRKMHLSISSKIETENENFKPVWNEKERVSEVTIDLLQGNFAGNSVTINL